MKLIAIIALAVSAYLLGRLQGERQAGDAIQLMFPLIEDVLKKRGIDPIGLYEETLTEIQRKIAEEEAGE